MFKPYLTIKSKARTLNGINKAIAKETGNSEPWFENENELNNSVKEGFFEFTRTGFVIYVDEI